MKWEEGPLKKEKLKNVHTLLKIYFGESWSEMEVLTFYKNIISKAQELEEMVEEYLDDIPEEKLDKLIVYFTFCILCYLMYINIIYSYI